MKSILCLCLSLCCLFAARVSHAQDMSTIPCSTFTKASAGSKFMILYWMDGYVSAKNNNTMMGDDWTIQLNSHIENQCAAYPEKNVFEIVKDVRKNIGKDAQKSQDKKAD